MLLFAASAFGIGLLLFSLMLWRDRSSNFYRPDGASTPTPDQQRFEPLPAPSPADVAGGNASGMGEPDAATDEPASPVIHAPPSAPPPPPRLAVPPEASAAISPPTPISSPPPDYPRDAFRNGESGIVLLRVHVDDQGHVYAVDLVESSRSRSLDRAASEAVRGWRFRPAQRDGQAVSGTVQVPIAFSADR